MSRLLRSSISILFLLTFLIPMNAPAMDTDRALAIFRILKETPAHNALQIRLYRIIKPYVGRVSYKWGGTSISSGIDCSAFTRHVLRKLGTELPRTVKEQARVGRRVGLSSLRPGDLVFFDASKNIKGLDHVGVYLGNGRFVHSHKGGGVKIHDLNSWEYPVLLGLRVLS